MEKICLHKYEYDPVRKGFYCVYCGNPMPEKVLEVPF
jgi:hypothetical protein